MESHLSLILHRRAAITFHSIDSPVIRIHLMKDVDNARPPTASHTSTKHTHCEVGRTCTHSTKALYPIPGRGGSNSR